MKNISLVLLAFMLTLTFTASDIIVEKGNKPDNANKCPYLEQLQQSGLQSECPYLSGKEGGSTCPYMKENSESANGGCPYMEGGTGECPYLNGNAGECPYLKEHGQEVNKVIETHPLPEGKNT
jgi:hypothetical protein